MVWRFLFIIIYFVESQDYCEKILLRKAGKFIIRFFLFSCCSQTISKKKKKIEHGQLGQGSNHSRSRPAPIEPFSERSFLDPTNYFHLGDVIAITCGWWYTILVTDHTHLGEKVEKKIEEMYSEGWGVERRRERGKKCGGEDGKYQLAKSIVMMRDPFLMIKK